MSAGGVRPALAVVTVTYESERVIGEWLESVRVSLPDAEIIVVDNGSTDRTAEIVRTSPAAARLVESGGNLGFARGCNLGASVAASELVWFLNPDARVESFDDAAFTAETGTRPLGLAGTAMTQPDGRARCEAYRERWGLGEWFAHVATPLWPRAFGRAPWSVEHGDDWLSGASIVVDAEEFRALGGFDESFFLLYEDRELCFRARRSGLPLRCLQSVVTSHEQGTASAAPGLDARRRSWAIVSWLEYSAATRGSSYARLQATAILSSLAVLAAAGALLGAVGASRTALAARLRSCGDVRSRVSELTATSSNGYYRRAGEAVSGRVATNEARA